VTLLAAPLRAADPLAARPRIVTVVGNRPQFVKAAAVSGPLREVADEVLVHTGQHHDPELSDVFFDELGIPAPDHNLEISGGVDGDQVELMSTALGPLLFEYEPDWVLLYGDTNSTLGGALAAEMAGIKIAHVEAGMRSFDMAMPEERNRIETDKRSALLLCSTPVAVTNLENEALGGRIELVGDVMADVVEMVSDRVRGRTVVMERLGLQRGGFLLVTAHRVATVDTEEALTKFVTVLEAMPMPAVLPLHPRTAGRLERFDLRNRLDSIKGLTVTEPLGYIDFQSLLVNAKALITDSGGAQKEAYLCSIPCVTLRTSTEWTETVAAGWNVLVGLDHQAALSALLLDTPEDHPLLYGDAHAGWRVAEALILPAI